MLRNELYKPWVTKAGAEEEKPEWGVEILDGEFTGVVIQITEMDFNNEESLLVDYHTLNKPDSVDLSSPLWEQVLQTVMLDIVKEAIDLVKNEKN